MTEVPPPNDKLALCAQTDPDMFFPDDKDRIKLAQAKAVCGRCPVQLQCLNYAIVNFSRSSDWGVWGGTSPSERNQLRRKRKRTINIGEGANIERGTGRA
jgi:WhiB family redox-sensing transcriptional regulator